LCFTDLVAGVLGATGSVGQRFILLLALHPHFELHAVGASERSAGKKYKDAVRWKQAIPFTERIGNLVVKKCTPEEFKDCDLVFSGLDSDVAGDVGMRPFQVMRKVLTTLRNGFSQVRTRRLLQREKLPP
jgi:aspartate-semialdehyde dehydrogenase